MRDRTFGTEHDRAHPFIHPFQPIFGGTLVAG